MSRRCFPTCAASSESDILTGAIPTAHQLRAALLAGRVIGTEAVVETARESYYRLPTAGVFGGSDLQAGELILRELGLLTLEQNKLQANARLAGLLSIDDGAACELLLAEWLDKDDPVWLGAATARDEVAEELIPDDALSALSGVVPDPERREAFLLSMGRVVRPDGNAETGASGEECVVAHCREELILAGRPDLAERVQRVSLASDQLGYDVVAPTLAGETRRLEVKTTRRPAGLRFYISRNEASWGIRDGAWALVICRIQADDTPAIVGWCRATAFQERLPRNHDARASWTSAQVIIEVEELAPGVPPA